MMSAVVRKRPRKPARQRQWSCVGCIWGLSRLRLMSIRPARPAPEPKSHAVDCAAHLRKRDLLSRRTGVHAGERVPQSEAPEFHIVPPDFSPNGRLACPLVSAAPGWSSKRCQPDRAEGSSPCFPGVLKCVCRTRSERFARGPAVFRRGSLVCLRCNRLRSAAIIRLHKRISVSAKPVPSPCKQWRTPCHIDSEAAQRFSAYSRWSYAPRAGSRLRPLLRSGI